MKATDLLVLTKAGLYCPIGDFYIDPHRAVERALITHGHADHARAGHDHVMATPETLAIMALRYGENFARQAQAMPYGEVISHHGVSVCFHSAGHILGSAQVCLERQGYRAVISGDYKRQADPTCAAFDVVACDLFVTEATFALPVFKHPAAAAELKKLQGSLSLFPERTHLVGAYALGKAQRVIKELRVLGFDAPIYLHGAMEKLCTYYQAVGVDLGDLRLVSDVDAQECIGGIVIAPPGALNDRWSDRFSDKITAFASGWMRIRARAKQRGIELPIVMSDHADWDDLCSTLTDTRAEEIWVTHGREDALVHWCQQQGLNARPLSMTMFDEGGDGESETLDEGGQA